MDGEKELKTKDREPEFNSRDSESRKDSKCSDYYY
jgi:hypothetical protein